MPKELEKNDERDLVYYEFYSTRAYKQLKEDVDSLKTQLKAHINISEHDTVDSIALKYTAVDLVNVYLDMVLGNIEASYGAIEAIRNEEPK